jgi:hypothetical protein
VIIRGLDVNGDFQLGRGKASYLKGQEAVMLNIKTRLKSFLNDAFWNMSFGIDWLNYLGNKQTQVNVLLACRAMVLQSFGVTKINAINYEMNGRRVEIAINVNTIYSLNTNSSLVLGA